MDSFVFDLTRVTPHLNLRYILYDISYKISFIDQNYAKSPFFNRYEFGSIIVVI